MLGGIEETESLDWNLRSNGRWGTGLRFEDDPRCANALLPGEETSESYRDLSEF